MFTCILAVLLIVTFYAGISSRLNGGTPKLFGREIMTVLSGSMEPGIQTGSIIVVRPVQAAQSGMMNVGDVITFKSPDDPQVIITHRIMEIQKNGSEAAYITKGDNNDIADPKPVNQSNIIAVYDNLTVPFLGYFFTWVKSKAGIIATMIVPGAALMLYAMVSIFRFIMLLDKQAGPKPAADKAAI
jgi:signal peptidase I